MMQMDILQELYETVESRRQEKTEGSYTCYQIGRASCRERV